MTEKIYTLKELAEEWRFSRQTIRELFKHEPGVLKVSLGTKKARTVYTVPASVADRVKRRISQPADL